MRDALALTDVAVRTFQNSLREGITEAQKSAVVGGDVKKAGGELGPARSLVFGERTKLAHGSRTSHANHQRSTCHGRTRRLEACLRRGIGPGCSAGSASRGQISTRPVGGALEATIATIEPGVTAGEVDAAGSKAIAQSGCPQLLRHWVGYQTGINWTQRGNLSLELGAKDVLETGMTLHMPFILSGADSCLFDTSEHVLLSERGTEVLSRTPHTHYHA